MSDRGLGTVVPDAFRRSLIVKFVTVLVVLAILISAVGFVATDQFRTQTKENVEREFSGLADSKATQVSEWYQQNRLTTRLISENDDWGASGDEMQVSLETKQSSLPAGTHALHVVEASDTDTALVASSASQSRTPAPLQSWLEGESFSLVSQVTVSPPYKSGGESVVAFVSPVGSGQDRVLVVEASLESLSNQLSTSGSTWTSVQVVDEQNSIVAAQAGDDVSEGVIGAEYPTDDALEPVQRARELRSSEASAGVIDHMPATSKVIEQTYTAGYAPIENTGWVVMVHAPRAQLFGFIQTISLYGMVATGGLVLVVGLIGVGLGYSVTHSINRLADKAETMEEGDLGVDLSTDRIDEIGQLYRSFESMRDEIRKRILDEQQARGEAEEARTEANEVRSKARQLAEHLEQKAEEYSDVMQDCADGDLTQRLDTQSRSTAMQEIGIEFNNMIGELEAAIDQVNDFADEVVDRSQFVMEGAESVNDASEQVAESIQQISDEADKQRSQIERFAADLHAVTQTLENLPDDQLDEDRRSQLETIRHLRDEIDEIAAFSDETLAEAENVAAAAEEQTSALTQVTQSARELHDYADPLGAELDQFRTDADMKFQFGQARSSSSDDD